MKRQISTKAKITKGGLNNYQSQTYIGQQKGLPLLSSVLPKTPRASPQTPPKVSPRASQSPTLVRKARAVSAPVLVSPKASPQTPPKVSPRASQSPTIVRRASSASAPLQGKYIKNTLFPEKKRILIKPRQFKANTIFTFLSHSIYNGNARDMKGRLISPINPPEYITYDMLIDEIGVYLNEELITDEQLKEQFKIATAKEQNALISELWRVWYNIIVGEKVIYKQTGASSGIVNERWDEGLSYPSSSSFASSASAPRAFPSIRPVEPLMSLAPVALRSPVSRRSPVSQRSPVAAEEEAYNDFLINEMNKYINTADATIKDQFGYTEQDYEFAYFAFANFNAKPVIKKAYYTKQRLDKKDISVKDIVCGFEAEKFPYPDPIGFNIVFQPSIKLHLYGMQLPHQFNREWLLNTMIYLFHLKIYNIADLQGCAYATNKQNNRIGSGIGCNPYDRLCEPEMWEKARELTVNHPEFKCEDKGISSTSLTPKEIGYLRNAKYYDIKMRDMTAGNIQSWNEISKIKDVSKPENSILVHCLAGAGRTGIVMLYLILRDSRNYLQPVQKREYEEELKKRLSQPHFGYMSITEVIDMLRCYFSNYTTGVIAATGEVFKIGSKILDRKTETLLLKKGVSRTLIRRILTQGMDDDTRRELGKYKGVDTTTINTIEKQQIKSHAIASLLRQRLNRIFFFLAKEFDVKRFFTYGRPTKKVEVLPHDEFSEPVMCEVEDWSIYGVDFSGWDKGASEAAQGWIN